MEGKMAIEYHDRHTAEGEEGAQEKPFARVFLAHEPIFHQESQQGGGAADEGDVGDIGELQGRVLGQEIERAAEQSGQQALPLIFPVVCPKSEGALEERQADVGDHESVENDVGRAESR